MKKEPTFEDIDLVCAGLSPDTQLRLIASIANRLHESAVPYSEGRPSLSALQLIEAQWVSEEHSEFVKLLQRYRNLYVTAMFVAFGWALGQLLGSQATTLEALRSRTDIATLLSLLPLINVLFALLMLEAHAHIADLARYRFVLGMKLGADSPPWRWNLWREKRKSTIVRRPTLVLNIFSATLFFLLTVGALWFSYPALGNNRWLWVLWGPALLVVGFFLVAVSLVGLFWLKRAEAVTKVPAEGERWDDLGTPKTEVLRKGSQCMVP